jgi:cyclopropane-fatty-acyl-phospholipid synthase
MWGSLSRRTDEAIRSTVSAWLAAADIRVNGDRPWDLKVYSDRVFRRELVNGSLGVGESYMDGDWGAVQLDELLFRAMRARVDTRLSMRSERWLWLKSLLMNRQALQRAFRVAEVHYDVGDDLYSAMLDPRMIYTCGYWASACTLAEAQQAKLDLIARKLQLQPGMRVLDVGCGWGGAGAYLARRYGVRVLGITVSRNQLLTGQASAEGAEFEVRLQDYRGLHGHFDRVYSLGMFEHVGPANYAHYFKVIRRLLAPDGLFLLHSIGHRYARPGNDPWIEKYIFPNSYIPSRSQVARAAETQFVVEDWHDFGPDYDRTLMAWWSNFERAWPSLQERYGERFGRMWRYWLAVSAASFRARDLHLWQVLLSPDGVVGGLAEQR